MAKTKVEKKSQDQQLLVPEDDTASSSRRSLAGNRQRLASLDIFRGLTVALMILVDDAGGEWPVIAHAPWEGCNLADFVMPFFLFIVGVSIALSLKRISNKFEACKKVAFRTCKLLFWGLLLQGGFSHAPDRLSFGVDVTMMRFCGILQRIALSYLVVALVEIFTKDSHEENMSSGTGRFSIFKSYYWHWIVGASVLVIYLATIYGTYVPDWEFVVNDKDSVLYGKIQSVSCGLRGKLNPPCNAVGYVDRQVLGINHMYQRPAWKRSKACTNDSPYGGSLRQDAPSWCRAPFEPEGILSSISAILSTIIGVHFGHIILHLKAGSRTIDLELTTLSSTNHVELTPSDAGFQDRYIVQEIIKEMAKNRPIDTKGKKGYKVLVLNEVDKLSREAQHSLRRTMEKYSSSCRLILCCNSSSKVTEAIKSRCLNVRINAPSQEEIVKVLEFVAKKESLQLPQGFAARIAEKSNRSLRRAILSLETCRVQNYPFTSNQVISPMDWEEYVTEIATDMMKEQSPKKLFQVRGKVYELLVNCIPPEVILKRLLHELLRKLDSELKLEVCHWAAYYEHRMRLGQKAIFHIEAFVAKFMSIYKNFLISTFG